MFAGLKPGASTDEYNRLRRCCSTTSRTAKDSRARPRANAPHCCGRIAGAAGAGVNYIQLREKDLCSRELERLAREAVRAVRDNSSSTKLLLNGRADIAVACGADGVHLPSANFLLPRFARYG